LWSSLVFAECRRASAVDAAKANGEGAQTLPTVATQAAASRVGEGASRVAATSGVGEGARPTTQTEPVLETDINESVGEVLGSVVSANAAALGGERAQSPLGGFLGALGNQRAASEEGEEDFVAELESAIIEEMALEARLRAILDRPPQNSAGTAMVQQNQLGARLRGVSRRERRVARRDGRVSRRQRVERRDRGLSFPTITGDAAAESLGALSVAARGKGGRVSFVSAQGTQPRRSREETPEHQVQEETPREEISTVEVVIDEPSDDDVSKFAEESFRQKKQTN
jgi:hypothetical protein